MQKWVQNKHKRIVVLFEGRDSAGKGGSIRRYARYLNPRAMRVVALPKPTDYEKGQWFFQRYIAELPSKGEIVFFDRSWYNRAVVEPVMGFCTNEEYKRFLRQVPKFEYFLYEERIILIKLWFSIDIDEQKKRLDDRAKNPLKQWKLSTTDLKAQKHWNDFTKYKERMFAHTHRDFSPWVIIKGNNKKKARLESMRYVLSQIEYNDKDTKHISFECDPKVLQVYEKNNGKLNSGEKVIDECSQERTLF